MSSRDPDDLHGDEKIAVIEVSVRRNGSMSVAGSINNLDYAIAMLDAAKDSLRNYHLRKRVEDGGLIIPAYDAPSVN